MFKMSGETLVKMETNPSPHNRNKLLAALKRLRKQDNLGTNTAPVSVENRGSIETSLNYVNSGEVNKNDMDFLASSSHSQVVNADQSSLPSHEVHEEESFSEGSGSSESKQREGCTVEEHLDETIYDDDCCDSKKSDTHGSAGKVFVDETLYDNWYSSSAFTDPLCDKQNAESGYGDCMLEEYVEVEGKYYELSSAPITKGGDSEVHFIDFPYFDESLGGSLKSLHEYTSNFKTDEERNKIYDKWMCDLETWERNRLLWLDQVGRLDGFDCTDENRTFLVKVDGLSTCEMKLKETCLETQEHNRKKLYDLERLQHHKKLHDLGLPNWYEDLLQEQNSEDVEVLSCSFDSKDTEQSSENANVTNDTCLEDKAEALSQTKTKNESNPEPENIPYDLTLVYEFTDHNLWRRYHNCYKQGKYYR